MIGLAETFSKQSELINLNGVYKNELEAIKVLHTLPKDKLKEFEAMTDSLLAELHKPEDKETLAKRSKVLREEGNRIYKAKQAEEDATKAADRLLAACRLYTQAILAAENAYDELALAYANRGLALQDFGYFQQAYDDHACALDFGYPEKMKQKLIIRQAHCAWKLNDAKLLEEHLSVLQRLELNENFKEQQEQLQQELKVLKTTVKVKQQQENNLEKGKRHKIAKESGSRGRHMIAEESIAAGDLIFTEQAECFVPVEQRLICQKCAAVMMCAPIPCPQCRKRVVYCSRRCRQLDANVHFYECAAHRRDLPKMLGVSHLALRVLITHLPQLLPQMRGSNARELWQSLMAMAHQEHSGSASQAVQSLRMITHLDKVPRDELVYHALCANLLQVYLHKCTKFYDLLKLGCSQESWHLIVAALLLRNAGQLLVNGHVGDALLPSSLVTNEFALLQPALWLSPYHLRLGCLHKFSNSTLITAINIPYLSLCNHSCAPSLYTKYDGCLVRNFAVEQLKPGDEIFNCYTPDCRKLMHCQRQAQLEDTYKFNCNCKKCVLPDKNQDYLEFHRYRCEFEGCRRIFLPKPQRHQDTLNWWMEPDEDIEIFCTFCGKSQLSEWYDHFMDLLERCGDAQGRRDLYTAFEGLETWIIGYHTLKLSLAKELVVACFAVKEASNWSDRDYEQLAKIIEFQLAGIAIQSGQHSNEYISRLTYLLDILAWKKHKCPTQRLQQIRSTFNHLAKETRDIFVNYYNDFIEQ